jgi:hypothetical protein
MWAKAGARGVRELPPRLEASFCQFVWCGDHPLLRLYLNLSFFMETQCFCVFMKNLSSSTARKKK